VSKRAFLARRAAPKGEAEFKRSINYLNAKGAADVCRRLCAEGRPWFRKFYGEFRKGVR
jgi:hypothetical protein